MDAFRPEVIYIPPTAGKAVWQLASEKNISLAVDESIDYDARYKRYFMDLPYFAALLRKTLLEKRTSFADYMKGLPEIRSASRTIKCEWQDIAEMLNGSGENTEKDRARFSSEVGEGWIYADGYRPIVPYPRRGADMETAEAICESCYEAVKRYLQKGISLEYPRWSHGRHSCLGDFSMEIRRLYLEVRSPRQGAPDLISPAFTATARSATVVSQVSPER